MQNTKHTHAVEHARRRGPVLMADGRRAVLVSWPGIGRRTGRKARVMLSTGTYLSIPTDELELIEEEQ
jgi:hypothetical protein